MIFKDMIAETKEKRIMNSLKTYKSFTMKCKDIIDKTKENFLQVVDIFT